MIKQSNKLLYNRAAISLTAIFLLCLEGLCICQHFRFFLTHNRHSVSVQNTYFFCHNFIRILLLSGNQIHIDQAHLENNNFPLPSVNTQHTNLHRFKHTKMCNVHPWHLLQCHNTMTAELPQPWERSTNCRFQEDYSYKFQLDDKIWIIVLGGKEKEQDKEFSEHRLYKDSPLHDHWFAQWNIHFTEDWIR